MIIIIFLFHNCQNALFYGVIIGTAIQGQNGSGSYGKKVVTRYLPELELLYGVEFSILPRISFLVGVLQLCLRWCVLR